MNAYLLLPLVSCIASASLGVAVLARDSTRRSSYLCALVAGFAVWWAGCEILWNTASNSTAALRIICASAPGWIMIGPAILHLFLELTGHPVRLRRWLLPVLYVPSACLVACDWATELVHTGVVRTTWGWGYEVGPLFTVAYLWAVGTMSIALLVAYRSLRSSASPAELRQTTWLFGGLLIPLTVASMTDGLLPVLGIQVPRLGASSIVLLAGSVAFTAHRYGYSMLAPGAFAPQILSTLREGVALLRPDGRINTANVGMGKLLGLLPGELEGRPIADFAPSVSLESMQAMSEFECELIGRAEEPVPVSLSTSLLRDKMENPIGLVLVARDLREVASLRSRLITSGRLASVGQLAAGIAHEINNPVAFIRSNLGVLSGILESLEAKLPAPRDPVTAADLEEGRELLEESLEGVDRVASIVRDVKGFSHAGEGPRELVALNPLLDSVLRVAAPQFQPGASVACVYGKLPPVRAASQELKQVFLNLIVNASQAVGEGEEIQIETRVEGDRVVVEVRDTGCGIPAEELGRVFDPFFTTKPVGEGTGLGLSISYQIVLNHKGNLSVASTPAQGTCFRVELPAADLTVEA